MSRCVTAITILAFMVLEAFLAGCGSNKTIHQNIPPTVQIITRPQGQRIPYAADFKWTGSDKDGVIDHYQYAIDVSNSIGIEQLNQPASSGVNWVDTDSTGAMFVFSTPRPDSLVLGDSTLVFADLYVGDHNLFVRSVDNEGAVSPVDYVEFTAANVVPKTRITLGMGECGIDFSKPVFRFDQSVLVNLGGSDPDRPGADKDPAWYEWKVIPITGVNVTSPDLNEIINVNGRDIPWNRISADSPSVMVALRPGYDQVLAVRSVDVQGGVESRFELGRNAAMLLEFGYNDPPDLVINEPILGRYSFDGSPEPANAEAPVGLQLRFDLSFVPNSAEQVSGYCVVVDPGPADSTCTSWNSSTYASVTFTSPGIHIIQFSARDCSGHITTGTLMMRITTIPHDRGVLYVDDMLDQRSNYSHLSDAEVDARAQSMLRDAGPFNDVFQIDTFDGSSHMPGLPTLAELARYKYVVWATNGLAYDGHTALLPATDCSFGPALRSYVASGGAVWIYGENVASALRRDSRYGDCRDDPRYSPSLGLTFDCPGFACDFLGLTNGDFRTARGGSLDNGLVRGVPTGRGSTDLFPQVEVDSSLVTILSVPYFDANFQPLVEAGLDTLYTAETASMSSGFNHKPIAYGYADPDPAPGQGPAAVFLFPFHVLKQGSAAERTGARGMARAMFEWFRSHGAIAG